MPTTRTYSPNSNTACLRLNRLIVGLEPDQYSLPAWHPFGVMTVEHLIELRAMELAVHGWDVRYGIDRSAAINPIAVPFLKGWVHRWLRAGFRPRPKTARKPGSASSSPTPTTRRTTSRSAPKTFTLDAADQSADADATLELDSSS